MFRMLLLLLAVVVVAGCIGGTNVDQNDGLRVNEFSAEPAVAEADDTVRLLLDVENVGGTTAECVTAELFGVESWRDFNGVYLNYPRPWRERGISFNFFDDTLNLCYYDTKYGNVCGGYSKESGVSVSGFFSNAFNTFTDNFCASYSVIDPQDITLKVQPELTPPLPERNKPGQSFIAEWTLRPPVLPEGLKVDYPVTARVSYFYTSNALLNVRSFNKAEIRRRETIGEPVSFPLEIVNTHAAPIQIDVVSGPSPIIINPDPTIGGPVELENFRFEIINTGQGFPLPISKADVPGSVGPDFESGFIFATMEVNGPGAYFYDCLGQQGTQIFVTGDLLQNLVKLRSDNRAPISCTIAIDKSQWVSTPTGLISIKFNMIYRYFVDRELTVRAIGVERL